MVIERYLKMGKSEENGEIWRNLEKKKKIMKF